MDKLKDEINLREEEDQDAEKMSHSSFTDSDEEEEMYDLLPDPLNDRKVSDVPIPPNKAMKDDLLFPQ